MANRVEALRTAIEMARANTGDPEYVARRLDEIEWGVDALLAERERLITVMREVADMGTLRPAQFNFGEAAARLMYMRDRLRRELAALDTEGAGHE